MSRPRVNKSPSATERLAAYGVVVFGAASARVERMQSSRRRAFSAEQLVAADLYWYFLERHAQFGHSSAGVFADASGSSTAFDDDNVEDAFIRAVRRERPIRRALERLPTRDYAVLSLYFGSARHFVESDRVAMGLEDACAAYLASKSEGANEFAA